MNPLLGGLQASALPLFMSVVVGSVFFACFRARNRRHPDEVGKTPTYSCFIGGSVGTFRGTAPFVRVSVYSDFTVIACLGLLIALRKGDVARIQLEKSWLAPYWNISMTCAGGIDPRHIELFTPESSRRPPRLEPALRKCLLGE